MIRQALAGSLLMLLAAASTSPAQAQTLLQKALSIGPSNPIRVNVQGDRTQKLGFLALVRTTADVTDVTVFGDPEVEINIRKDGSASVKAYHRKVTLNGPTANELLNQLRDWAPMVVMERRWAAVRPEDIVLAQAMEAHDYRTVYDIMSATQAAARQATQPTTPAPVRAPVPTAGSSTYLNQFRTHWIDRVSSDGELITLEDGSLWQIESMDQLHTSLWLPVQHVIVIANDRHSLDYKYVLVNDRNNEHAAAKCLKP